MFEGNPQYPVSWDPPHRVSDMMHEMGHVLYLAGEHYRTSYNCSSIIGHCNSPRITQVQQHDKDDFSFAYRMIDAPNATYGQLTSSSNFRHFFEGRYLGGNGQTIHAEKQYWIDRSLSGLLGQFGTYSSVAKRVDNVDDTTPNSVNFTDLPSVNNEWCFKMRGETGAIANPGLSYRWGPYSRAYCVAKYGSRVFIASNRNDWVGLRVWSYSGATIQNVTLTLDDANQTLVCSLGSIVNGGSPACLVYLGNASGYVNLYYNNSWIRAGTVGYDGQ